MWLPLITELGATRTVIAPDLRGAGESSKPADGYTKAEMAADIHALARSLGYERDADCGARHRIDGGLRLRGTVSERSATDRFAGCVFARAWAIGKTFG